MSTTYQSLVRPEFDSHSESYQVSLDRDTPCKLSTELVFTLSSISGDEPRQMLPLNSAVDPDVLESHVQGRTRGAHLSFEFHGYDISVRDDAQVTIRPVDELGEQ